MSEKIDVLAVMDSVIQRSGHVVACDVVAARAAVAELLEVVKHLRAILPSETWADDARKIADAAIANASGRSG